jgi:hypothetical protein
LTNAIPKTLYAIADALARVVINYRGIALIDAEEVNETFIILIQCVRR